MPRMAKGHRLRKGRFSEPGRIYSVTISCHQKSICFPDWPSGRCFVHAMHSVRNEAETLCFVVMPDHVHWLLQLQGSESLSRVVQKTKSTTTRAWRRTAGLECLLWQRGFYDRAIRKESDIKPVARYIVANPLRAGLVRNIADYPLWDAIWL